MTKKLTKEMLQEMGITDVHWDEETNSWCITRNWHKCGKRGAMREYRLAIRKLRAKRKYTQGKEYPGVVFSYQGKTQAFTLSRFIYAWFHEGGVPEGMDVDHRNNDKNDTSLSNLVLLTREENLAKRFSDNPNCYRCQWDYLKKHKEEK